MFRRTTRALACLAFAASVALACNAISGLDADFEVAEAVPPAEGGTSGTVGTSGGSTTSSSGGPDGQPLDAPNEASPPADAGQDVQDAGTDAQDAAAQDAGTDAQDAGFKCPPTYPPGLLWCDDFEDTGKEAPLYGWSMGFDAGGTPKVESARGVNGTRGLHSAMTTGPSAPGVAGGWSVALLENLSPSLSSNGQKVTLALSFTVNTVNLDYTVVGAMQLVGSSATREYGIAIYRNASCPGGGSCIDEDNPSGGGHTYAGAVPLELGRWYRAEITLAKSSTGYAATVVLDGSGVPLDSRTLTLDAGSVSVQALAGAFFGANNGSIDVAVDEVLVAQ